MDFNRDNFFKLLQENESQRTEILLLNEKIQYLIRKLFGKSSEKISPDQLDLFLEEFSDLVQEAIEEKAGEGKKQQKRGKKKPLEERIPENLPVERVVIEPEEVLADPDAWEKIGEEVTVELDVNPARIIKREIVRPKYKKKADREQPPVVAPAPARLVENSHASVGLLVYLILGKYCDHLPLYRQSSILKIRYGVEISRKTMGNWMYLVANWLGMIYEAMRAEIRASGYIQVDETPIEYIEPGKGGCAKGQLWAYHAPTLKTVLFEWHPSRASDCLDGMLDGFQGLIQSDGYGAYEGWYNKEEHRDQRGNVVLATCWAHARRKFYEARQYPRSAEVIEEIRKLYLLESALRETPGADRSIARKEQAEPVLENIKAILEQEQPRQLPQGAFGKAISYTLKMWDKLVAYIGHGALEIDNNLTENAIRPTAIGKKNWLFFGSSSSGQTSAILYTVVETCRKLDINPDHYLRETLAALPTMMTPEAASWTPIQWKARRLAKDAPPAPSAERAAIS